MGFDHFDGLCVASLVLAATTDFPLWPFWVLFGWCSLLWLIVAMSAAVKANE